MTSNPHREGKPNPDAAIVEAALEKVPQLSDAQRYMVWVDLNVLGKSASQIAQFFDRGANVFPDIAFAQALREGIAARRGQRFGGHGGKR